MFSRLENCALEAGPLSNGRQMEAAGCTLAVLSARALPKWGGPHDRENPGSLRSSSAWLPERAACGESLGDNRGQTGGLEATHGPQARPTKEEFGTSGTAGVAKMAATQAPGGTAADESHDSTTGVSGAEGLLGGGT